MIRLFHLYLITGGMPAAVQTYIDTKDLIQVESVQKGILTLYRQDIQEYNPGKELRVNELFDLIPSELNSSNKRFILKNFMRMPWLRNCIATDGTSIISTISRRVSWIFFLNVMLKLFRWKLSRANIMHGITPFRMCWKMLNMV